MKNSAAIFLLAFQLSGCSLLGYEKREALGTVELYPANAQAYQLRLAYRVQGRGSVHDLFDYKKRDFIEADWFFLTSDGAVAASDSVIHDCSEGHEKYLYGKRQVRGNVRLSSNVAEVALQVRDGVKDGIPVWEDYEHNGTYVLVRPENKPEDAVPASSAECFR